MNPQKPTLIFEQLPTFNPKEKVYFISSQPGFLRHAPEGSEPHTVEEFLKVAKEYWEVCINTKTRIGLGFSHQSYRVLFKSKNDAEKACKKLWDAKQEEDRKRALEIYKNSKWKDEAKQWTSGDQNENKF